MQSFNKKTMSDQLVIVPFKPGLVVSPYYNFFPRNAFFTEAKKDVGEFFTRTVNGDIIVYY